jgi:hypothetical protein
MKSKLLLTLALLQFTAVSLFSQDAQEGKKIFDLGIAFSSLNNFGINFKTGNEKTLLRVTALALNVNASQLKDKTDDTTLQTSTDLGAGFRIGFERRIELVKNFHLLLGSDAGISYTWENNENGSDEWTTSTREIRPALFFVFGLTCKIGDHFIITGELAPSLYYDIQKIKSTQEGSTTETSRSNIGFALSNNSAGITLAYRITR